MVILWFIYIYIYDANVIFGTCTISRLLFLLYFLYFSMLTLCFFGQYTEYQTKYIFEHVVPC